MGHMLFIETKQAAAKKLKHVCRSTSGTAHLAAGAAITLSFFFFVADFLACHIRKKHR